jgi:hypothetical protein
MQHKPFYEQTVRLFSYVRDSNFDDLAQLCDDDFGIVDIDTDGGSKMIRNRQEWENWFRELFAKLAAMNARTDTEILKYDVMATSEMAYSVVEFCQRLYVNEKVGKFYCVVTIIWKKTQHQEWKEARWHASLLRQEWE